MSQENNALKSAISLSRIQNMNYTYHIVLCCVHGGAPTEHRIVIMFRLPSRSSRPGAARLVEASVILQRLGRNVGLEVTDADSAWSCFS
eukprot:2929016-Pleurochrysis_carterae.AAC.1